MGRPRFELRGRRVLVTGASSGLGKELAVQLALEHGADLVLVARRGDRLRELCDELTTKADVNVQCIAADLSTPGEARRVLLEAREAGPIDYLVLNAGVTHIGRFEEQSWEDFSRMLTINVTSAVELLRGALPSLRASRGAILIVSSLSGLTPAAYQTAYSGTKAFLLKFGWALHHELRSQGIGVSVFAPGGIVTEMTEGPSFDGLRSWLMPVDRAARAALRGFVRGKPVIVPGLVYDWGRRLLLLFVSEDFLVGRVARQYEKSLEKSRNS